MLDTGEFMRVDANAAHYIVVNGMGTYVSKSEWKQATGKRYVGKPVPIGRNRGSVS